jgi:hypothetical protein
LNKSIVVDGVSHGQSIFYAKSGLVIAKYLYDAGNPVKVTCFDSKGKKTIDTEFGGTAAQAETMCGVHDLLP